MFQQLEIDYTIGMPHPVAAMDLKEAPIIRMCAATSMTWTQKLVDVPAYSPALGRST